MHKLSLLLLLTGMSACVPKLPACSQRVAAALSPRLCPAGTRQVVYTATDGSTDACEEPDGTRHGPTREYYTSGRLRSQVGYQRGAMHGPSVACHPNGKLRSTGTWVSGRAAGPWRYYDEQGEFVNEEDPSSSEPPRSTP